MGENISWYLKDQVAVIKGQGEMERTCDLGAGVKTAGGSSDHVHKVIIEDGITSVTGFHSLEALTAVSLPNSVTEIGVSAFSQCKSLKEAPLSDSIVRIGNHAFSQTALEELVLPDSVTEIGSNAFRDCPDLKSVRLSQNLQVLGEEAFSKCTSLTAVELPASLTDIGDSVFYSSSGGDSMEITIHEPTMTAWLEALPLRSGSSTAAS